MNGTIAVVMAALVAVLAAIGLLGGGDDDGDRREAAGPPIAEVARGVERVRELRFEHLPRVEHVTGAQARAAGLRELDRDTPPRVLAAQERVLKLLGLLPPDADVRDLTGKTLATEVGGFYVPRTGRLAIVGGFGSGLLGKAALAHELTHALEDQHFGIERRRKRFELDASTADSAFKEGTATIAMVDYVVFDQTGSPDIPARIRAGAVKALGKAVVPESSGLPRYLRESLIFPYAAGARLVDHIENRGGWEAVNRGFGSRGAAVDGAGHAPGQVRLPGAAGAGARGRAGRDAAGGARRLRRVRHRADAARGERRGARSARGCRVGRGWLRPLAPARRALRPVAALGLGHAPRRTRVRRGGPAGGEASWAAQP